MNKDTKNNPPEKETSVENDQSSSETNLLNEVIKLTGVPANSIHSELKGILDRKNIDVNNMTLDQLRSVVASYLRETMGSILDQRSSHKKPENTH